MLFFVRRISSIVHPKIILVPPPIDSYSKSSVHIYIVRYRNSCVNIKIHHCFFRSTTVIARRRWNVEMSMRIIKREKRIPFYRVPIKKYFSFFFFFFPLVFILADRLLISSCCSLRAYVLLYTYAHICETSVFIRREVDVIHVYVYTCTTTIPSLSKGSIENLTRKDRLLHNGGNRVWKEKKEKK